ncbi:hypothetical protein K7432_009667 [Basidiobolus ranarum]|uniref:Secreted protein n=1 Tax=Basidiobolus ranarum TaxID=34480 RepID=A0ABR2WPW8_9FUNG
MRFFLISSLFTLLPWVLSAPLGVKDKCSKVTVFALQHSKNIGRRKGTFSPQEEVSFKWEYKGQDLKYISEVGLFNGQTNEFLHSQYRSHPGKSIQDGEMKFILEVPLCLQRYDSYYLRVYASTKDNTICDFKIPNFKISSSSNENYSKCKL